MTMIKTFSAVAGTEIRAHFFADPGTLVLPVVGYALSVNLEVHPCVLFPGGLVLPLPDVEQQGYGALVGVWWQDTLPRPEYDVALRNARARWSAVESSIA